ncbi:hypothetical protein [Streptomyces sp. NPDC096153]
MLGHTAENAAALTGLHLGQVRYLLRGGPAGQQETALSATPAMPRSA